ncbi:MAG: AMP-binding protein [Nitrospiria bacterium]
MEDIVWSPSTKTIEKSNIYRLMQAYGIGSYEALREWSVADIGRFWDAVMKDLSIAWERPYDRVFDASAGLPWTKWFVGGRTNIVTNCIDRHLETRGKETALVWENEGGVSRSITYRGLHLKISALAAALRREGIGKGDTVGIYMPMSIEMVTAFYAALKIGAIVLPVFSGFASDALAMRLRHADAKILFTADGAQRRGKPIDIKQAADAAANEVPSLQRVVCLEHQGNAVEWNSHRDCWYPDFIGTASEVLPTTPVDAETPAIILYTSGTTGRPKGTVHSHGGCIAQIGKEMAYHFDLKPANRLFWLSDIGWMMGPWMIIGAHLQGGAAFLYDGAPNYPAPDRLWEMAGRQGITHLGISPTAIRVLMRADEEAVMKHRMASLRILGSTGEPWDDESYLWYFEKIGKGKLPIINISGGTEIIGCFLAPLPIAPIKKSSLQGPGLGMDCDVFDDAGKPVRGKTGHLVCKQPSPSMTRGFWKDRPLYLETYWSRWTDIWFHGDWARIDADGHWFLHGRSDDTFNVAGRRIAPPEIESVLIAHPNVSEAAVIGIPDPLKGEAIVAFVVPQPGAHPDLEALKGEIKKHLGKVFLPRAIYIVNDLPKTRSAKIVRRIIRARYLGKAVGDLSSVENPKALYEIVHQADGT